MPPRPARALSLPRLAQVALSNSLAACDAELFDELIVERRYFFNRVFIISDPDGIKRVMLDNQENYPGLPQIRRMFRRELGDGLLALEGEPWRRHRRIINATMDSRSVMMNGLAATVQLAESSAAQLAALPPGAEIMIGPVMHALLLDAVRRFFAGSDDDPAVGRTINRIAHLMGQFHLRDFLPGVSRLGVTVDRGKFPVLYRLIAERRQQSYVGGEDLIRRLLEARDRRNGDKLDDTEIYDEIVSLAHGSILTTLRALTWFWYVLALHPSVEARVHAELEDVLGGRAPSPPDFSRLPYLDRVIDETMRLYPPIPMMLRTAAADDVVCGRRVPKGSIVAIMPWVIHRHRKLWDEPDRFDPGRFAREASAARPRYAYLPFSTGPRVCVGESLASLQIRVIVAILAQRFRFRLVPGHLVEPTGLITLRSRQGIRMIAEPRATPPPSS
jgi:cytochrome P450